MIVCKQCGNHVDDGMKFCTECGTRLGHMPPPEPTQQLPPQQLITRKLPPQQIAQDDYDPNPLPGYEAGSPDQHSQTRKETNKRNLIIIAAFVLLILGVVGAVALALRKSSNDPPTVQAIDVDKTTILPGEEVNVTARASDPNDEQLNYEWSTSVGRIVGSGANVVLNTWGVEPGEGAVNVIITLTVKDPAGELASAKQSITIIPESGDVAGTEVSNDPSAPMILKISTDKRAVQRGEPVILKAEVANRDAGELTFDWKTSAGSIEANGNTATLQTSAIRSSGASQQVYVTLTVTDGSGAVKSLNQVINVMESAPKNWPPTVELIANKSRVQQGEEVSISAQATDRDGDSLSYSWSSSAGQLTGSGNRYTLRTSSVNPGQVEVRATVADGRGETATARLLITVTQRANNSPTVGQIEIDRTRINAGERVNLRAVASDADGDDLRYQWSTSAGAIRGSGPSATVDTSNVNADSGSIQVTVTLMVTDQRGGLATGTRSFTVVGETAKTTRPGPVSISAGQDGENLIVNISNTPGRVDSQSGSVQVVIGAFGSTRQASGFFPGTACRVSISNKDNVDEISFIETPSPANRYSRARVRVRPKKSQQPVRFTITWRAL